MKKIIFTLALLVQVGFAMANNNEFTLAKVRHENVRMFQQAGTSTTVVQTLSTTDKIEYVRMYNDEWAIVMVNGKAGYVLVSEIIKLRTEAK
ncbi:SH3 domain-containing protein [Adhaeribacter aquaticus]|uniref:SH3 domain-containing protein n=1 Tax=Adhaeribacter aquaticus TaxID=299567 RepID=UPI000403C6D3|nr:SH3 domain-containing protein [Adhaeribacter aquaticus]